MEETKMHKNYLMAIAVAALLTATTVAQAADVTFSGQFRPRFNIDNDASDSSSSNTFTDVRVRLNAKAKVNANTEVFLQFQSVGTWGATATNAEGTRISEGGGAGTGAGAQASDLLQDVGFHQAYLTLKNLAGYAADLKIGRQEVVVDGHRLFGHTGWTQGAETKDAIRLTHAAGNHTLNYTFIKGIENDSLTTLARNDSEVHFLHAQTQGIMGGTLTGIFTITDDDGANDSAAWEDHEVWYTIGARQKGKLSGLDYRVEYYHQFGDGGNIAVDCACAITGASNTGGSVDRDAHMFGLRLGKTFKNAAWSPTLTLWFDSLSGIDDDDAAGGDYGVFDTMYDTGHKFYGLMDFYLNRAGSTTGYYGLEDYALKFKGTPKAGWTVKADFHHFRTQTEISGGDANTVIATDATLGGAMDEDLGTEIDLTLAHKYDANTTIALGYSHYFTTSTFGMLNGGAAGSGGTAGSNNNDDADWTYLQIDTRF
jgi:hypothetical protein